MRFSAANPKAQILQRRERWKRDHAASATVGSLFPTVQCIHIQLGFSGAVTSDPVPQAHVMHPPAKAFFNFLCPFADCDGHYDLSAVVAGLMKARTPRKDGKLECTGMRFKGGTGKQPCQLQLHYEIKVDYQRAATA